MPEFKKKKILWVVYDFNQAGGQRYVYEICKALNKDKFEVDVLKLAPMGYDKNWEKEFYYQPTLDLGCGIFFLEALMLQDLKKQNHSLINRARHKLSRLVSAPKAAVVNRQANVVQDFFSNYGHINFSGLNVYKSLCLSNGIEAVNSIIHILTAKFQDTTDIYNGYNKDYPYHFVSSFSNEILAYELKGFNEHRHTYYPLCFETIPYPIAAIEKKEQPFVIAVFTRLSRMKPLDPYFYAFKLLLEKGVNAELRIYGAGDPEEEGLIRQLNYLYLTDKVRFAGHLESMPAELVKAEIDLIWFQSNNQMPAGYAALEVAMSGLPQVLWDFSDMGWKHSMGDIFPSFTSLTQFVECSQKLLNAKEERKVLGLLQQSYVLEQYSIKKHIHIIEELFV